MAHFARVDDSNIVTQVIVIPDQYENDGKSFINNILGIDGNWVQTSYTSREGTRRDPDTNDVIDENDHFRYNFASPGYTWDENFGTDGAFIPPRPEGMNSWVISPLTASWIPPVDPPVEGMWQWDESTTSWIAASYDVGA